MILSRGDRQIWTDLFVHYCVWDKEGGIINRILSLADTFIVLHCTCSCTPHSSLSDSGTNSNKLISRDGSLCIPLESSPVWLPGGLPSASDKYIYISAIFLQKKWTTARGCKINFTCSLIWNLIDVPPNFQKYRQRFPPPRPPELPSDRCTQCTSTNTYRGRERTMMATIAVRPRSKSTN